MRPARAKLLPGVQLFIPDASPRYGVTLRSGNRDITLSPELAAVIWGDSAPGDGPAPAG